MVNKIDSSEITTKKEFEEDSEWKVWTFYED